MVPTIVCLAVLLVRAVILVRFVSVRTGMANPQHSTVLSPPYDASVSATSPTPGPIPANTDAAALIQFSHNVTKDPFGALDSWTSHADTVCTWSGILCNNDGRVISVLLQDKRLEGTISSALHELFYLEHLNLQNNLFTGPVPPELGILQQLQQVLLQDNELIGNIPGSFQNLLNLETLNLSSNRMSGNFPEIILYLRHLTQLDISNNNFNGVLEQPPSLQDFKYSNNPQLQVMHATKRRKAYWASTVAIVVTFIMLSVFVSAYVYYKRKCQYKHSTRTEDNHEIAEHLPEDRFLKEVPFWPRQCMQIRKFSLKDLKVATRNFSEECRVGAGGFGTVYKALLKDGETVALKRAHKKSVQGSDAFWNEVELVSKVHHRHLVNLVGFCGESHEQILVYEFIPNGSLLDHLSGAREPLTWRQRVTIAIGAAKGLSYLHEDCSPAIIHRDIKPSNILIDYDFEAKVSDFGLSKHGPEGDESHVSTLVKGTVGYLDPHYYLSFHLTTSSDVYSFGMILLQLVTARPVVDHSRKRSQYNIISWAAASIEKGQLEHIIDPSLVQKGYDREIILLMARLGLRCTSKNMNMRPRISFISQELEKALCNYDIKMNLAIGKSQR